MKTSSDSAVEVRFDEAGAEQMDRTAVEIFGPIYPVLAGQIVRRMKITNGRCVEIGSGPGLLGLALARITGLHMILLDAAMPMHMKARKHLSGSGYGHRFSLIRGDVHHIPLNNNSVHLMVSRGSIFFWKHPERAFSEIHRVLLPGGRGYVGGGFGTADLRDHIAQRMAAIQPGWRKFRDRNMGKDTRQKLLSALQEAKVSHDIIRDDSGFWIIIKKE